MPIEISPGIVRDGLVLDLNSNALLSYPGSGASWWDTSKSQLISSGNGSYISGNTNGAVSGVQWATATTDILNTDTHSIFFMVRFNTNATYPNGVTGGWEKIFGYNGGGSDRSPGIWRWPSNRYIHWRYDPSNSGCDFGPNSINSAGSGSDFTANTWYYVGVTKNSGTATCYVNGSSLGTAEVSNPKTAGTSPVYFFEYYTNPLCNINNIVIYNTVLSAADVSQNWSVVRTLYSI